LGLLDQWLRSKKVSLKPAERKPSRSLSPVERTELAALLSKYQRLRRGHDELLNQRGELARKMEFGEITGSEFRAQLMEKVLELAKLTEDLQTMRAHLTILGYQGIL
jgi:hypothetical protein